MPNLIDQWKALCINYLVNKKLKKTTTKPMPQQTAAHPTQAVVELVRP